MKKSLIYSALTFITIIVITIIVILKANGYIFNIKQRQIEQIGYLRVNSTPSNAEIYINKNYKGKTPLTITDLKPDKYEIEIKSTNYLTWEAKVDVTAGNTEIVDAILYRSKIKEQPIEKGNILNTYFGKNMYLFTNNDSTNNIYFHLFNNGFLNISNEATFSTNLKNIPINSSYKINKATFSYDNNKVLLRLKSDNLPDKHIIVDFTNNNKLIDLDTIINTNLYNNINWAEDSNELILSNKSLLTSLSITDGQEIILDQETNDFTIERHFTLNNLVYIVIKNSKDNKYKLISTQRGGTNKKTIKSDIDSISDIIVDRKKNNYSYSTSDTTLRIYNQFNDNFITITSQINNTPLYFSPDSNFLIYKDSDDNLLNYSFIDKKSYQLNIKFSSVSYLEWDYSSRVILFTMRDTTEKFYSLYGINYNGNNKYLIYKDQVSSPYFTVNPNKEIIYLEDTNIEGEKNIYQILINE